MSMLGRLSPRVLHPAMAIQGTFVVVADGPAQDIAVSLHAAGAFPIIEATWSEAPAALASVEPEAVVLADCCASEKHVFAFQRALSEQRKKSGGALIPIIARAGDDCAVGVANALVIAATAPVERITR